MDQLTEILTEMGHRIADHGCDGEPAIGCLARAAGDLAPVAADVLGSRTEPENARCRAFLQVALAAEQLTGADRQTLAAALTNSVEPAVEPATVTSNLPAVSAPTVPWSLVQPAPA